MAKVTVDASLCTGCGLCVATCPDCFEMNNDNVAVVKASDCPNCDVKEVASQCPVEAIKVA